MSPIEVKLPDGRLLVVWDQSLASFSATVFDDGVSTITVGTTHGELSTTGKLARALNGHGLSGVLTPGVIYELEQQKADSPQY